MRLSSIIYGYLLCAVQGWAAALPKEILPARETFEVGLEVNDKQGAERLKTLGDDYLAHLVGIEREMQSNAQFRALVTVHDELVRFGKARIMPPRLLEEPVELKEVQSLFQFRLLQTQYSNELAMVKLAEHYVQELAAVRAHLEKQGGAVQLKILDEERDRVIGLVRLRRALELTKIRPPASLDSLTNSVPDGGDSDRVRRVMELSKPNNEPLQATIGYAVRTVIYEDSSRIKARKTEGAGSRGRSFDGLVLYTPRISISSQHSEVASGSKLVIEYFSRSVADRQRHRETSESVLLPRIDRGETYTFEAKGVQLYRSEQVTTIQRVGVSRSFGGSEFYGLILHLLDPDGRVLLQRYAPQSLDRELNARPPEK